MIEKGFTIGSALEGLSYAGKSTSLEWLKAHSTSPKKDIIIVPEYSEVRDLSKIARTSESEAKSAANIIIDIEKRRTNHLTNEITHSTNPLVIWDRSPISCLAFEYAAGQIGHPEVLAWLADKFQSEFEKGNIIVPSKFIFLRVTVAEIAKREAKMLATGHRGISEFLRDDRVMSTFNLVFKQFAQYSGPDLSLLIDSKEGNLVAVAEDIYNFAAIQETTTANINYPDFVGSVYAG